MVSILTTLRSTTSSACGAKATQAYNGRLSSGVFNRIQDWCERAKNDWQDDDLQFDAYLNFKKKWALMATFNFESLRTNIGSWGDMNWSR